MDRQITQRRSRVSAEPERERSRRFWSFVNVYGATHFAQRIDRRPRASIRRGHIAL